MGLKLILKNIAVLCNIFFSFFFRFFYKEKVTAMCIMHKHFFKIFFYLIFFDLYFFFT